MNSNMQIVNRTELMQGSVERKSAAGNVLGRTLSFISKHTGGDVRKALKETGLKGKALDRKVNEVLRGESPMAWAVYDAEMSVARSLGFTPERMSMNKKGNVLTPRLVKTEMTATEAAEAVKASMTKEELLARLAKLEAAAASKKDSETSKADGADKAGAINV